MRQFFILLCLLYAGCGKKPRSLVPQQAQTGKPSVFNVPRATRLRGTQHNNTIRLTWAPIADERLHSYALYKFARGRFLRHKPYAIIQAPDCSFDDNAPYHHYHAPCYAIRPCYLINSYVCMGALSNVLCFEKKKP